MTQTTPAMTSADVRELEPCPFCGAEQVELTRDLFGHRGGEDNHGSCPLRHATFAFAQREAWNTRHSTPAPVNVDGDLDLAEKLIAAKRAGSREQSDYRLEEMRSCIQQGGDFWGVGDWDDVRDYVLFAAKARAARTSPAPVNVDQLREALEGARKVAAMLLQNAEGCAANHYGNDMEIFGVPGWLRDARSEVEAIDAALASMKGPEA